MKIRRKTLDVHKIRTGECFLYNDHLYMYVRMDSPTSILAVSLETANEGSFDIYEQIIPVNAVVTIEEIEGV